MNEARLLELIKEYSHFAPKTKPKIVTETTQFMSIKAGDVLLLDDRYYLVRGEESEGRFGLEGDPKFWVKRAIDLHTGEAKIVKLVFHESFTMWLGEQDILCYRSPRKEARILERVRGDDRFMQGHTVIDSSGNHIRIIDRIPGRSLFNYIQTLDMDHETYFFQVFPSIFPNIFDCVEAIHRLHQLGELHGDIRNDHIYIRYRDNRYIWIDFDYTYDLPESPYGVDLFGLGNILLFTVGNGFYSAKTSEMDNRRQCKALQQVKLQPEDMSLFFRHRICNLKKLFPYIPEVLNHVLMFFSFGAEVFFENTAELLEALRECLDELHKTGPLDGLSQNSRDISQSL